LDEVWLVGVARLMLFEWKTGLGLSSDHTPGMALHYGYKMEGWFNRVILFIKNGSCMSAAEAI